MDDARAIGPENASKRLMHGHEGEKLCVLVCEDSEADYILLRRMLEKIAPGNIKIDWVKSHRDAQKVLARNQHDIALVDYRLGDGTGLELLREATAQNWSAPIVLLTGVRDPAIDTSAMHLGACDFLLKDELQPALLDRCIRYNIERKRREFAATETNRELFQYIRELHDAKVEIELQNQRIVSLAYHLASVSQGDSESDSTNVSRASREALSRGGKLGSWSFDAQGNSRHANPAMLAMLELRSLEELHARPLGALFSDESRQRLHQTLFRLSADEVVTIELELVGQASGQHKWVVMSLLSLPADGLDSTYSAIVVDITGRHNVERANRYLARHDSLTGLSNRTVFHESLHQATAISRRNGTMVGVLCIDLDGFKAINDTYGHTAGDQVLCQVAERLRDVARESDHVARLGGDEFGIVATNLHSYDDALVVANKFMAALEAPYKLRDASVVCGGSVGVAVFPVDHEDLDELFEHADTNLYRKKRERSLSRRLG